MSNFWQPLWDTLSQYAPKLAAAVGILVAFWIGALIVAAILRGALKRTQLDDKVVRTLLGADAKTKVESERWISRAAFYGVMLFGIVAFFNALGLLVVTEPINRMLGSVLEYAPRLLSAGLLLLLGFLAATAVKKLLQVVLDRANFDERVGTPAEGAEAPPISAAVSNTIYWLILLLFLPLVLDALALGGLLEPLQVMLARVLGFLPNLFAAVLIFFVGWFAARIARQIVTRALGAVGFDNVGRRAGVEKVLGKQTLSGLVGLLLYALILIPVAIAAIDALELGAISAPAGQMLSTILEAIPAVLGAALILAIAYIVGRFAAAMSAELLARIGFDNVLGKLGISDDAARGRWTPSEVVGQLVLITAIFFAAIEAARQLGLQELAVLLVRFTGFAGHVLLGLIIFGVGLYLANLAAGVIRSSRPQARGLLAGAARVAILSLAATMALREMGLAEDIINRAFTLLLGAIAVAVALAFGLGARELAAREVEGWLRSLRGERGPGA